MTRRSYDRLTRTIIPLGIGVSLAVIALYVILLNRPHIPTCNLVKNLPGEMTLGQRYPVELHITLPWRQKPSVQTATVTGDLQCVAQDWSVKSPGPGYTMWKGVLQIAGLEKGPQRKGLLTVTHTNLKATFDLGPATVNGLLTPDESFTPTVSDYSPSTNTIPYALWGAILFGAVAGAGFIYVLSPKGASKKPLSPGGTLSAALARIATHHDLNPSHQHQLISDSVRQYISSVWEIPVHTQGTDELLKTLKNTPAVPAEIKAALRDYLTKADQSKYAPGEGKDTLSLHLDAAHQLLDISEAFRKEVTHDT